MKFVDSINELRTIVKGKKLAGKTIGFVPTMGALHEGHMSLIEKCVKENDFNIVSIFVNPTQFGPNEDFNKYPRTLEADSKMCEKAGVDVIFVPSVSEMYTDTEEATLICPPYSLVNRLCGKSRVGHFDGVATVVAKFFNITGCQRAYFGEKDAQQLFIIQKMVKDLNFDVEIVPCPIVREPDGLAMSSRNTYLTPGGRCEAIKIHKALSSVKKLYEQGENEVKVLRDAALSILDGLDIGYFDVYDLNSFEETDRIVSTAIVLCAVKIYQNDGSSVRLIDNIKL